MSSTSFTAGVLLVCQISAATLVTTIALELNLNIGAIGLTSTTPIALPTFLDLSNSTKPSIWWGFGMIEKHLWWMQQMPFLQSFLEKGVDANQTGLLMSAATSLAVEFSGHGTQFGPSVRNSSDSANVTWTLTGNDVGGRLCSKRDEKGNCYIELSKWVSIYGAETLNPASNYGLTYQSGNLETQLGTEIDLVSMTIIGLDGLAKSLYWTILTDLGQSVETNAFTDAQQMLDFWNATERMIQNITLLDYISTGLAVEGQSDIPDVNPKDLMMTNGSAPTDPVEFFAWFGTGLPQAKTSTIATQYLCSVPKLKSRGSLIVGILVADFVFFQVVWHAFNLITVFFLDRQQPQAQYCSGCTKRLNETSEEELEMGSLHTLPSRTSTRGGYERVPGPVGGFASTAHAPATTSGAEYLDSTVDHRVPRKPVATAQPRSVGSDYDEHDMSEH